MKWPLSVLVSVLFCMLVPLNEARADSMLITPVTYSFCFTNNSGMTLTSGEVRILAGGTLTNPRANLIPGVGPAFSHVGDVVTVDLVFIEPGEEFCLFFEVDGLTLVAFDRAVFYSRPGLMGEPFPIDPLRDNVRIEAVPEPITVILLGLGLAGVTIRGRGRPRR